MKRQWLVALLALVGLSAVGCVHHPAPAPAVAPVLRVSENQRYLIWENGNPFLYLADTAWELFHRLDRVDADYYLEERAAQKFTVIQAVVLAEFDGLTVANANGELPLIDNDPARPNVLYFEHVDYIVNKANSLGLFVGMLPTWGDKVNKKWGVGPEIFTAENAAVYGEFLGKRYKDKGIIWILGGDRPVEGEGQLAIWRAMAEGIKKGDGGRHLMTYHINGGTSSSASLQNEGWLDFNMLQSGHARPDAPNWEMVAADYAKTPVKPVVDGESNYEDHPINWKAENGYFDAYDVRKAAYRGLFAGSMGLTYGCHDVWQFYTALRQPISAARTPWMTAMHFPGARQMQHIRALVASRPYLERVPDQSLLAMDAGYGPEHCQATRGADGSYAFVYSPLGKPVTIDLAKLTGDAVVAYWFDPRTGETWSGGRFARTGTRVFTPPSMGRYSDWVLVLDDESRNYPPPGDPERFRPNAPPLY